MDRAAKHQPVEAARVLAVGETLLIEATVAGNFAARAGARGSPALAADLRALRARLQGLAGQLWEVVQSKPGTY